MLTAGILIFLGPLLLPYAALFYSLVIATLMMMSRPYRAHVWIPVSATLWSVVWIKW